MIKQSESSQPLLWEELSSEGPSTAFSAGCVIGGALYVHGGVSEARSTKPLPDLHRFNLDQSLWELVDSSGPSLSHHACFPISNHHIAFIGGWNGRERISDVHIFDCEASHWLEIETTGFPVGAGLSSHTANLLSNGDVLIIGREGSLRTQRRSGNAFILSGSVTKRKFVYKEMPISVSSRSGHTTSCLKSSMLVVGGRSDKLGEIHKIPQASTTFCPADGLLSNINKICESLPNMSKLPSGRKNHSASTIGDFILIFGGETFDGRSKEPVSEVYVVDTKANYSWKMVGRVNIGRAGHISETTGETVIIHGGVGEKNHVSNITFRLKLS